MGHRKASDSSPEYPLLGFLYFQPLHGYDLHKRLNGTLGEVWALPQNQVYNILKRLEQQGYIQQVSGEEGSHTPNKQVFTLTTSGKARFETWLMTPTPGSARALRMEFISRLFFATQISEDLYSRLIQEQYQEIYQSVERLKKRLEECPAEQVFNRMGIDLRLRQLKATLEWLETFHQVCEEQWT
jgi:DNA-binding PadR family transcriptional regulator